VNSLTNKIAAMAKRSLAVVFVAVVAGVLAEISALAQAGAARPSVPPTAQAIAPADLTGYWVSIVSDEWAYRMVTPPKGNVDYLPLNAEGRRVASEWDAAKDQAAGEACRGYGAGGIMRLPERLHITWQDPDTLKIDIDTGTQTRLLHFGKPQPASEPRSWQGYSRADWEFAGGRAAPGPIPGGQLRVVTTAMRTGYLRKNGIPYGEDAVLTEYFVVLTDAGNTYLAVTSMLEDPKYLAQPWIRTSQFKRQPNGAGWSPSECSAD
jgi:hypothetical protein